MDRSNGRPVALEESTPPGVPDGPLPAQTGNGNNGPCIGGMAPGAAARVLREVFGFEGFRPGQEGVIETLLAGRHALTVMPTARASRFAFQIPAPGHGRAHGVVCPDRPDADQVSAPGWRLAAAASLSDAGAPTVRPGAGRRKADRLLYMAPSG